MSKTKELPKRLAFSVENILDPNKFTGKTANNNNRLWSDFDRSDDKIEDEQSDSHSGEW